MNELARQLVATARLYLGPAAPSFMAHEVEALGLTLETVTPAHTTALVTRIRASAYEVMSASEANALMRALVRTVESGESSTPARAGDLGGRVLAICREF